MSDSDGTFSIVSKTGERECVIKLQGDIDLRAVPGLRGALGHAIDSGPGRVIVDLGDTSTVDVTALAVLVVASHLARDAGTPLLLQAPSPDTVNLLTVAGLDRLLPVVDADSRTRPAVPVERAR